jgi:hypothetical protein
MSDVTTTPVDLAGNAVETPQGSSLTPHDVPVSLGADTAPEAAQPEVAQPEQQEVKEDPRSAAKFAALSRKERQLRQTEKSLKAQQAQIATQMKQFEAWQKEQSEFSSRLKSNPLELLEKHGLSYKDLTEQYILKPEETPEQKTNEYIKNIESKLNALEEQLKQKEESVKKQQEEAQVKNAEHAKNNYLKQLTEFVNKNTEQYELIAKNDAVSLVFDVMEQIYQDSVDPETGASTYTSQEQYDQLRDIAAKEVENYLFEEAKKLIESNKLKSLYAAAPAATKPPVQKSATLSNTIAQTSAKTSDKFLSDDESKRRIAAKLKWIE